MSKKTIKDVAREAGVSTATISRVINNSGYVSEEVRKHVLLTIERLNYYPNAIARSLKQEKTRSIGIVVPDLTNPYFMKVAKAIQDQCMTAGYHLLFMNTDEDSDKEKETLQILLEKRVDAIILAGTGGNEEQIKRIHDSGTSIILVDRRIGDLELDIVVEDNIYGAQAAIDYLIHQGHRRLGIINGPQIISTGRERLQGVLSGLSQNHIELLQDLVYQGNYSRESGKRAIYHFMQLTERPTAIFSANNEMTFGVYLGLQEMGIPLDELEVVSFGDLEFSSLFCHKLSVVTQNPEEIGQMVGNLVLRRLSTGNSSVNEKCVFTPKIISKYKASREG